MALEPVKSEGGRKAGQTGRKSTHPADRKLAARKARRAEERRQAADPDATAWLARRHAEQAIADARRVLQHAERALEQAERALRGKTRKRA